MVVNPQTIKHHCNIDMCPLHGGENFLEKKVICHPRAGVVVCVDNFTLNQSVSVAFTKKRLPCFEFVYILSADCELSSLSPSTSTAVFSARSGTRTVVYDSELSGYCELNPTVPVKILNVYITPKNLLSILGEENHSLISKILTRTGNSDAGFTQVAEMKPVMESIVHQIVHCNYCDRASKLFIEGKILELFACEIEDFYSQTMPKVNIHPNDIKLLDLAKTIMMDNMASPPTIDELARKVGLNQKKLKTGFRQLYNTTVFGFLKQYRMEQARLLFERDMANVGDVAWTVGYANASHFSAAFRDYSGINPSEYLKVQKNRYTSRKNRV